MDYKNEIVQLLGLKADATDEVISNAAKTFQDDMVAFKTGMETENDTLKNSAAEAIADKEALKLENDKLTNSNKTLAEELATTDLEKLGEVITNDNRDSVKAGLISNRKATLDMFKGISKVKPERSAPLHNSRVQHQPAPIDGTEDMATQESEAQARKISNRAREIRSASPSMSYQSAFLAAQGEHAKSTVITN